MLQAQPPQAVLLRKPAVTDRRRSVNVARDSSVGGSAHSPRRTCAEPSQYAAGQVMYGWNQLWQEWGLLGTGAAATLSNYLSLWSLIIALKRTFGFP